MTDTKRIVYIYRGTVEKARHIKGKFAGYHFKDGFSAAGPNGEVTYPWMTTRECQADAHKQGATAEFRRPLSPLHPAMVKVRAAAEALELRIRAVVTDNQQLSAIMKLVVEYGTAQFELGAEDQ